MAKAIEILIDSSVRGVSASWVRRIVAGTLEAEKKATRSVSVLLTNDDAIRVLNKKYLKHDRPTDVIAFWVKEPRKVNEPHREHLGDVVVSVERAKKEAPHYGVSFREELARYIVHGVLHLVGYNDESDREEKVMHKRQEVILKKLSGRK